MKRILLLLLVFTSLTSFGQQLIGKPEITYDEYGYCIECTLRNPYFSPIINAVFTIEYNDKDPRYKYKTTRVNVFVGAFSTGTVFYYAPENYWYKPVAHTLDKVIFKNKQERIF